MVTKVIDVPIDALLLDLENPRHGVLKDQADAMREMIVDQGEKLVNLAKDIVNEEGVNPSDLTMVISEKIGSDKYVVVEGNRRLAALKILLNPSLAGVSQKASLRKQFNDLSREFAHRVTQLRCVVFDQRGDATHWIQLKHTGENNGIGVVTWDAESVARFKDRNLGKRSLSLQVVEFVRQNASLDELTKKNIETIPITNIDRLMADPAVRDALGIRVIAQS